jgi:hypothetical protein
MGKYAGTGSVIFRRKCGGDPSMGHCYIASVYPVLPHAKRRDVLVDIRIIKLKCHKFVCNQVYSYVLDNLELALQYFIYF